MGQPSPCRPLPPSLLLLIPSSPARPPWGAPCSSAGSIAAMRRWSTTASPLPHSLRATGTRSCAPPARLRPRQRLGRPGCGRLLWVLLSPPTPPLIATGDAPPGVCATGEPLSFGLRFLRPRPALPELAPNCCRPLVDADGFQEVLPRAARRRLRRDGSSSSCHRHRTGRIQGRTQDLIIGGQAVIRGANSLAVCCR